MPRAVGIDLGTTNSVVSVLEGGEPTVIANAEGSRTTPSVVAFAKNGEVLVGDAARRRQTVTNDDTIIRSVKPHMGTGWTVKVDSKDFTPQQISAFILQKLKRDAESYLGESVADAVITVPAYFDDAQRQATTEAGTIAGLNVLRIVNEPTAAALAYGLDKGEKEQTILVFDLGGGTFDVSLLEIGDGVVEVKSTSGDTHLGGDDWDQRVVDHLIKTFNGQHGVDLGKDKMAMQRLREAAEKAKIELSQSSQTGINLPYITASSEGPLHLDVNLSRAEFQRMTSDLLDRCKHPFQQAIKDASIKIADIDHVVLVGGSTRMPAVVELVRELTGGKDPNKGVNPDEVVAVGASLLVDRRLVDRTKNVPSLPATRATKISKSSRLDGPGEDREARPNAGVRLFVSYSHRDEHYREQFSTHLSSVRRQGLVAAWDDREIIPGMDWDKAIAGQLEAAELVVLLVSPDFIASDYAYGREMTRALARHEQGSAHVVPVIVRPADWRHSPLDKLQALPTEGRPISTWPNEDDAWLNVVIGIRRAIQSLRTD